MFSGHGGAEAATFAKEHLINLIVNQKAFWSDDDRDVLRAIREGYIATHYAMWREQGIFCAEIALHVAYNEMSYANEVKCIFANCDEIIMAVKTTNGVIQRYI